MGKQLTQPELMVQLSYGQISLSQAEFVFDTLTKAGLLTPDSTAQGLYDEYFSESTGTRKEWQNSDQALEFWAMALHDEIGYRIIDDKEKDGELWDDLWTAFEFLESV